jgi:hypothetical protein
MKIYITGCARSGTWLLNRLFYAFEDMHVHDAEIPLLNYVNASGFITEHVCAKRSVNSIYSNAISQEDEEHQCGLIARHDIKVINILRDGRDVCHVPDKGTQATPARWMASLNQAERAGNLITASVYYEDICNPKLIDDLQADLALQLGLQIKHMWSEYPEFVPDSGFAAESVQGLPNYGKRVIEASRHDNNEWKQYLDEEYHEVFKKYLEKFKKRTLR